MTQVDKHLCEYAVINVNTLTNIWLSVCLVCTEYNVLAWVSGIHWFFLLPNLGWAELRKTQHAASYFVFSSSHCIDLQRLPLHTGSGGACCFESLKAEFESRDMCYPGGSKNVNSAPAASVHPNSAMQQLEAGYTGVHTSRLVETKYKQTANLWTQKPVNTWGGNCVAYLGNQMIITCNVICQLDFIPA